MDNSSISTNFDYDKIKSYLVLLRANLPQQKEIAENFFNKNKNNNEIYKILTVITENLNESDDIRLQAIVITKKLFNLSQTYLKYEKKLNIENDIRNVYIHNALASEEIVLVNQNKHLLKKPKFLIESLPYIDTKFKEDPRIKEKATKILNTEIAKLIEEKPLEFYYNQISKYDIKYSNCTEEELKRIEKDKKLSFNLVDIETKFEQPPPSKYHDYISWSKILDKISISGSQLTLKHFNLELFAKFGSDAWKKYLTKYEEIIKQLENEKNRLESECVEINSSRKFKQTEFQENITELEGKLNYYISQLAGIQNQYLKMKYKVKRLAKYKGNKIRKNKKKLSNKIIY